MSPFTPPEGVPTIALVECSTCHSPTPEHELAAGLCRDCVQASARLLATSIRPPEDFAAPTLALPIDQGDELEARRRRRQEVKAGTIAEPQGWLQHAMEAVRTECVRGRHGHEFTIDAIADELDRRRAPTPERTGDSSLRFVMESAAGRGWCEKTGRSQPSRRPEMQGKQVRIYRSLL